MKKSVVLLSALLCAILLLSACAPAAVPAASLLGTSTYEETPTLTSKSSISSLDDHSLFNYDSYYGNHSYGELAFFRSDDDEIRIYNVETANVILTVDYDEYVSASCFTCYENTFVILNTKKQSKNGNTEYSCTLYSAQGNSVATEKGQYGKDSVTTSMDMFQFASKIYRVSDKGEATFVCDTIAVGSLPSFDCKTLSSYYRTGSSSITIYDHSLNKTFYWEVPVDTYNTIINPLAGGKILVQYLLVLPFDAKSYDVTYSGSKFELVTLLIDTVTGKEKKLNLNYLVDYVDPSDVDYGSDYSFPNGVQNIAYLMPIKDKRIVEAETEYMIVDLSSDGKIISTLYSDLEGITSEPYYIANDRLIYSTANGDRFLIDASGNQIGKFNGYNNISNRNEKYFTIGGKIYDYSLKMVYDCEANNSTIYYTLAHGYILQDKNGDYELFTNGSTQSIDGSVSVLSKQLYTVYDKLESKYTLYNDLGREIMNGDRNDYFNFITSSGDYALISVYDYSAGETVFYSIKK